MCARSALALSSLRSARSSSDIFHLLFGLRAAGQLEVRQLHDFRGGRLVKLEQALSALSRMSRAGSCSRFKAFRSQGGGLKRPLSIATKRHHRGKGPPELQVPGGPSSRYATLTEHHFRTGSGRRLFPIERARETALRGRRGQEWRDRQTVSPAPPERVRHQQSLDAPSESGPARRAGKTQRAPIGRHRPRSRRRYRRSRCRRLIATRLRWLRALAR
jgi:hypothetical protein